MICQWQQKEDISPSHIKYLSKEMGKEMLIELFYHDFQAWFTSGYLFRFLLSHSLILPPFFPYKHIPTKGDKWKHFKGETWFISNLASSGFIHSDTLAYFARGHFHL